MKTNLKILSLFIPVFLGAFTLTLNPQPRMGQGNDFHRFSLYPASVQAQDLSTPIECKPEENLVGCIDNPVKNAGTVSEVLVKLTRLVLSSIAIITVVVIMYGGVLLIFGSGNPTQRKKAKEMIIWALIGLMVTLMSYSIVAIVGDLIKTSSNP